MTAQTQCESSAPVGYSGYSGLADITDLTEAASIIYEIPEEAVMFGTQESECDMGLLVFMQGDRYGVVDIKSIDSSDYSLTIEYWVGCS